MVNEIEAKHDPRFLPNAQAFSACTICDASYPLGTESCPKCHSPLSSVRRCPDCQRILSSRHETCIYCAHSLLAIHAQPKAPEPIQAIPREAKSKPNQIKAVSVALAVFLAIVGIGVASLYRNVSKVNSTVKGTSFAIRNATLHTEPSEGSATARTVPNGTILNLSRVERDSTGKAWFMVPENGAEYAVSLRDVAPPKASEAEEGYKMLQAWLTAFDHPELAADAVQAVNYYCSQFPAAATHCADLRWNAAERIRNLAPHSAKRSDLLMQSRDVYTQLAEKNGPHAEEAKRALGELSEAPTRSPERPATTSGKASKSTKSDYRQYALVDAAEVQLRIPDLSKLTPGQEIRTPIAHEIRVNGQLVVPGNATCILNVVGADTSSNAKIARLSAIEFGGRRYQVTTEPKRLESPGSIVVFRLDSSLLIGH